MRPTTSTSTTTPSRQLTWRCSNGHYYNEVSISACPRREYVLRAANNTVPLPAMPRRSLYELSSPPCFLLLGVTFPMMACAPSCMYMLDADQL